MIRPPRLRGAAFTDADAGDLRAGDRRRVAARLGIPPEWATVRQIHGGVVRAVDRSGDAGEGDGLVTTTPVPLAVFVADCVGVIVEGDGGVGVAHAGWRGLAAGVVAATRSALAAAGVRPIRAAIGPSIGPCCYEVGDDVLARFPDERSETTWGTASVDLWAAAARQLDGLDVWQASRCTRCEPPFFSYRRDATDARMAAIGWLP